MTDEQLQSLFAGMERRLEKRADATDQRVSAGEQRMTARMEELETKLLTEFHKWASPAEARARGTAANLQALDLEVELLKDRVTKLEGAQSKPS